MTIVPSPAGIPAGSFSTSASCSAAEALCRPSSTGLENGLSTRIVPGTGTSLQEVENPTGREYNFSLSQKTSGGGLAESDSVNWPLINGNPETNPLPIFSIVFMGCGERVYDLMFIFYDLVFI